MTGERPPLRQAFPKSPAGLLSGVLIMQKNCIRMQCVKIDYPRLLSLIEEIREKAELIYMIDHDKRKRYIYAQADTYDQTEQI